MYALAWLLCSLKAQPNPHLRPHILLTESKSDEPNIAKHALDSNKLYWILGSLSTSDIVALNPSISRRHAALYIDEQRNLNFIDLKSKAGSFM